MVAIALILSAVFVPVALLGGLTGRLYQQFALTIAISVLLSAFLALSLAPALCAMILKPAKPTGGPLGAFYRGFNKVFDVTTPWLRQVDASCSSARRSSVSGSWCWPRSLTGALGKALPAGFVPDEDMGIFMINVQLPPASSLERTDGVVRQVEERAEADRGHRGLHRRRRLGHPHQLVQPRVRVVLLQARAVGGAEDARAARRRASSRRSGARWPPSRAQ